jgi:hypothetical protein
MLCGSFSPRSFAILAFLLVLAWPCRAQPGDDPQMVDPKACADRQRLPLENKDSPRDPSKQSLSEKLDRTEGVICPPNVDPDMRAPAPNIGNTPIIPPPGSPGGNPNVRPK